MSTTTGKTAPSKTPKAAKDTSKAKPKTAAPTSALDGSAPASAKKAKPTIVGAPQPVILGPVMRKKELVDTIVMRSGMKKKDVKPAVEATLEVLGEALLDNRELILPPMGRLKIKRAKQLSKRRVVSAKIIQSTPPKGEADSTPSEPEGS